MPAYLALKDNLGNPRPARHIIDEAAENLGILPQNIVRRVSEYGYTWEEALTKPKQSKPTPKPDHPWKRNAVPMEERTEKYSYQLLTRATRKLLYSTYDLSYMHEWIQKNLYIKVPIVQLRQAVDNAKGGHGIVLGAYILERHKLEKKDG